MEGGKDRERMCLSVRQFHKYGLLALGLALLTALGACSGEPEPAAPEKSLYEQGLEVAEQMREMAGSDEYLGIYSDNAEIRAILKQAAGAEEQPQAVYRVRMEADEVFRLMGVSLEDFPASLRQTLRNKTASAAVTQLNGMGGSATLAAASLCTAQKLFVFTGEMEQNEIYLYIYESATPVAVTFTKGEGGAVLASGMFVLYDGFSLDSLEDVKETLSGFGVTVEKIAP